MALALVLLAVGLLAIFLELIVPAAGVIGIAGFGCLVAAVVLGYVDGGTVPGTIMLLLVVIITPAAILIALKVFPKTFVGKRFILRGVLGKETDENSASGREYPNLLGKEGIAHTVIRPSGTMQADGKKYNVVTNGEYIKKNAAVKITAVEGNRIVVKQVISKKEEPI